MIRYQTFPISNRFAFCWPRFEYLPSFGTMPGQITARAFGRVLVIRWGR